MGLGEAGRGKPCAGAELGGAGRTGLTPAAGFSDAAGRPPEFWAARAEGGGARGFCATGGTAVGSGRALGGGASGRFGAAGGGGDGAATGLPRGAGG